MPLRMLGPRALWILTLGSVVVAVVALLWMTPAPLALGRTENLQSVLERDEITKACVGEFKSAFVSLGARHPELELADQFPHSYLGYTFINNDVQPRFRVVLSVDLGRVEEMWAVPADGYDVLPDVPAITSLTVECESEEIRRQVEALYVYFQVSLRTRLRADPR